MVSESDTQRWQRIFAVFEEVLDAPREARDGLLARLCAGDEDLRREVAELIAADDTAPRFEAGLDEARRAAAIASTGNHGAGERAGDRIGPWRLLRELGAGGMGVVWLAERADGQFEQRVALKLIRSGLDSDAVHRRFLRERQILARLHHPHIAHLIDGGITASGGPYFAMEYVEGLPLLQYCREHNVGLEGRIRIFLDICAAVQFAHEHQVVHRDLKPSNVLVTRATGVKLLDFGIAKLFGDVTDAETITHLQREQPMTPIYAAPEQLRGGEITPAADVYALGCMLYELLTEKHTHNFKGAISQHDVLGVIESEDPRAPSRIEAESPPVPPKQLRGNLDIIVLTALRREPEWRYASVTALVTDLQNHLAGKAISARREQLAHRVVVFLRRHRANAAAISAATVVALAAIVFVAIERQSYEKVGQNAIVAVVDFNNLAHSKDAAWISPALGQMLAIELALGGKVHTLSESVVHGASSDLPPPGIGGYTEEALTLLHKRINADYVLSGSYFLSGASNDANLRLDIAVQDARTGRSVAQATQAGTAADLSILVSKIGDDLRSQLRIAQPDAATRAQAVQAQPQSTDIAKLMGAALQSLRASDPAHAKDALLAVVAQAPGYAPAYVLLAQAWKALGYDAKALAMAQQAAAHSEGLPAEMQLRIAREVAVQQFDWPKAVELDGQLLALAPQDLDLQLALADDLLNAGKPDEADRALEQARAMPGGDGDARVELEAAAVAAYRGDIADRAAHAEVALQRANANDATALAARAKVELAWTQSHTGKDAQAQEVLLDAIDTFHRIGNPQGEAAARLRLASLLATRNQSAKAREQYQLALDTFQRIGDQKQQANTYKLLNGVLWDQGDGDAAVVAAQRGLTIAHEIRDPGNEAWFLGSIAMMHADDNASDATLAEFRHAIQFDESVGAREDQFFMLANLADTLRLRGDLDAAQRVCEEVHSGLQPTDSSFAVLGAELSCATLALDRGETDLALSKFDKARQLGRQLGDNYTLAGIAVSLAGIEIAKRDWDAARALLKDASDKLPAGEFPSGEANLQAWLAVCEDRLGNDAARDRALQRARDVRARMSLRYAVFPADVALALVRGTQNGSGRGSASESLIELASDADARRWPALAIEARLALLSFAPPRDEAVATEQRALLDNAARRYGFVRAQKEFAAIVANKP